jgi:LmbE family N-acetylglucosaminyl deacetylase
MSAFDLDPAIKWLFCFAHPDDELSIVGWISRLVQNGNEVHIAWMHSNPVRERESRLVAKELEIDQDRLRFFGATDGSVISESGSLIPRFRKMLAEIEPDRVACGAFEQGHIDHDATNFIVNQCFDGSIFEVPLYHTYATRIQRLNRFSQPLGEELLNLGARERALKKSLAKRYPSQRIWKILFWYELISTATFRPPRLAATERMRLQTHRNWLAPNHPEPLREAVAQTQSWLRWQEAVCGLVEQESPVGA